MKTAKRFRVFDIENQTLPFRADTLEEVVDYLTPFWKDPSRSLYDFAIDDVVDDIEINWSDLMESVDDGEAYEDLQGF